VSCSSLVQLCMGRRVARTARRSRRRDATSDWIPFPTNEFHHRSRPTASAFCPAGRPDQCQWPTQYPPPLTLNIPLLGYAIYQGGHGKLGPVFRPSSLPLFLSLPFLRLRPYWRFYFHNRAILLTCIGLFILLSVSLFVAYAFTFCTVCLSN